MRVLPALFSLLLALPFVKAQSILTESKWLPVQLSLFTNFKDHNLYAIETRSESGLVSSFSFKETGAVNVGVGFKKFNANLWYQEYALVGLDIRKTDESSAVEIPGQIHIEPSSGRFRVSTNINLRWEFGKYLAFNDHSRFYPGFGIALDPFLHYGHIFPKRSATFPYQYQRMGITMRAVPAMAYRITANILLQLKLPLGLSTHYLEFYRVDNPIVAGMEREHKNFDSQFRFYDLQASLGLSFRLRD